MFIPVIRAFCALPLAQQNSVIPDEAVRLLMVMMSTEESSSVAKPLRRSAPNQNAVYSE
jgi:hypothetical protein